MHISKAFEQTDTSALITCITNNPFATVICNGTKGIEAHHIPLHLVENGKDSLLLKGHIARANKLWKTIEDNTNSLVIFQGPHSYISPNLYPTKQEHGKAVPTWNYISIHIRGNISFIHDSKWKLDMLNQLTNSLEAKEKAPWQVADAPRDYIEKQLGGIVGLEITINSIEGQWKLSQNQPAENQAGVIKGLAESTRFDYKIMSELVKNANS